MNDDILWKIDRNIEKDKDIRKLKIEIEDLQFENHKLKQTLEESMRIIKQLKGSARYQRCMHELDALTWILDGKKQYDEYRLIPDENGTKQINGEWYRVEKIK